MMPTLCFAETINSMTGDWSLADAKRNFSPVAHVICHI